MRPELLELARTARGFMPDDEGLALYEAALTACQNLNQRRPSQRRPNQQSPATIVEIGSYCGKSTIYLGAAAASAGAVVVTIDHHRGSEEMQDGWEHHDSEMIDGQTGRFDSLHYLRATLEKAQLEDTVITVVGDSATVAQHIDTPAAMVFIDGGHGHEPAHRDYESWTPKLIDEGLLAIHDVFENPADGGRPPYEIYCRALDDGFSSIVAVGSLRVLRAPAG